MTWELLGSGNKMNINNAASYESSVAEGQNVKMTFNFITPVPDFELNNLFNYLSNAGVDNIAVAGYGNSVDITFLKNPWWIPVIIVAVLVIVILLISWFLFKEVLNTTGPIGATALVIGGAVVAVIALVLIVKPKNGG